MPKEIQWNKREAKSRERRAPATPQRTPCTLLCLWGSRSPPIRREVKDHSFHSHSICFSAKMVLGLVCWFTCLLWRLAFFRDSCLEKIHRSCILYSVLALSGALTRTHYLLRTSLRISPNVLHEGKNHLKLTNTLMPPQFFCPTESICGFPRFWVLSVSADIQEQQRKKDIIAKWVDKGPMPFSSMGVWIFPSSV